MYLFGSTIHNRHHYSRYLKNMRTLLIDGTNLFIINYTVNASTDPNGVPTGGIAGTLRALKKIITDLAPEKVVFVWDGSGGSLQRKQVFAEYKDGRKPITVAGRQYAFENVEDAKQNIKWQMSKTRELIATLPLCQIVPDMIEADDAIAYLAKHRDYFGHRSSIIVSCDKDFYQLIDEKTAIFNPQSKKLWATKQVIDEYNIHPKNWLFYKAVCGDKSDNIPGVKGIGAKTLAKMFELNNPDIIHTPEIIEKFNVEQLDKNSKTFKMYESLEIIKRNWKIMSLTDIMMPVVAKDKLTEKIKNFSPALLKTKFYIEVMKYGGLGLQADYFTPFLSLVPKITSIK